MEKEENEFPKKGSSGHVDGERIYYVQARYNYPEPREVAGILLDNRWKRLHFQKAPYGVPLSDRRTAHIAGDSYMNYEVAQALRWWFHAEAEREILGGLCLETRLIECELKYEYSVTEQRPVEHIGEQGGVSSRLPAKEQKGHHNE